MFSQVLKVELICTVLNRSCKARVAHLTSQYEPAYFVVYSALNRRMQADSSNVAAKLSAKLSSLFTHTPFRGHIALLKKFISEFTQGKEGSQMEKFPLYATADGWF